jgi:hypothetical protein
MKLDKLFITGCDVNTEWQLAWFWENYKEYNDTPLLVMDFGMSKDMRVWVEENIFECVDVLTQAEGWFKKPSAMLRACEESEKVCWLDTDCQVFGDISPIFDLTVPFKIGMVEDRPWTKRRGEYGAWYNSGVVVWEGKPNILRAWAEQCINDGWVGDQETLYAMMGGDEIMKMSIIEPLPHKYNTLRLDYVDNIAVKNPLIVHHTGKKGKEVIKEQIDV